MKKKPLGKCCPVLELALERHKDGDRIGLTIGHTFHLNGKHGRPMLVYNMRKGKKAGEFARYADTTYAPVAHCPFCGEDLR